MEFRTIPDAIRTRHRHLVNNPLCSDVSLYVESENCSIPAHCCILVAGGQMFRGILTDYWERSVEPIVIHIDPSASKADVLVMLDYLYTGCLEPVTLDKAIGVVGLACHYLLHVLSKHCLQLMSANVRLDNVRLIFTRIFDLNAKLRQQAAAFIESHMVQLSRNTPDDDPDAGLFAMEERMLVTLDWRRADVLKMFANLVAYGKKCCREQSNNYEFVRHNCDWFVQRLPLGRLSEAELAECLQLAGPRFFGEQELEALRAEVASGELAAMEAARAEAKAAGKSCEGMADAPVIAGWYKHRS